jgi:CHASE2 domain-containing sensor protein
MRSDVRQLLLWLVLTIGFLTMTGVLIANGQWFSAAGAALGGIGSASRWGAWRAEVTERHRAEREAGR